MIAEDPALDGKLEIAATRKEPIDYPRLLGFGPRPDTLLLQVIENGEGVWQVFDLKERTFGPPMEEAKALGAPIVDPTTNRTIGGVYVEDDARYVFFDPVLQNRWMSILHAFGDSHVRFVAASEDFKKIVVRVERPRYGYRYQLVDLDEHKANPVGDVYEGLTEPLEVRRVTYAAADGLRDSRLPHLAARTCPRRSCRWSSCPMAAPRCATPPTSTGGRRPWRTRAMRCCDPITVARP